MASHNETRRRYFTRSRGRCSTVLGLGLVVAWGTAAAAQTRVAIRPLPKPGQVIHVTTQQEVLLRTGEKAAEPGPAQRHSKGLLVFTQKNGQFAAQDRMEAQVTIERLELENSAGGRQRSGPDTTTVKGRVLVIEFDRSGKLLGIKVPPDMREVSSSLTQLLAGAYGTVNFLPDVTLGVGEETSSASELPMRLPGTEKASLETRVNLTLRAIDKKGNDRVARLTQRIDVATETSQLKVTGGGTIDVNLDGGFVSATDTEWEISGTAPAGTGAKPSPPFYGSIKIRVSAE
jgi:hypothetical protein